MKKIVSLLLVALMMLGAVSAFAEGEIKLGQAIYPAHGTHCFSVFTAVVQDGTILAAKIDEFQFMGDRADLAVVGVPNSDLVEEAFSVKNEDGSIKSKLGSKRVNSDLYSLNMQRAGSTVQIAANYDYIEAFVVGKTVEQLEKDVTGEKFADAVTSATLVDTTNYVKGIIEAAKAAEAKTGTYTFYNKTGETVTELYLVNNKTGEKGVNYAANGFKADAMNVITRTVSAQEAEGYSMTVQFKTEGGYEAKFENLHIEVAPITLLAADALTGPTPISFFAPAQ